MNSPLLSRTPVLSGFGPNTFVVQKACLLLILHLCRPDFYVNWLPLIAYVSETGSVGLLSLSPVALGLTFLYKMGQTFSSVVAYWQHLITCKSRLPGLFSGIYIIILTVQMFTWFW